MRSPSCCATQPAREILPRFAFRDIPDAKQKFLSPFPNCKYVEIIEALPASPPAGIAGQQDAGNFSES